MSDDFGSLPPSAKLVHKVLEYEAPLTQKEIIEETKLTPRTVRYALGRLEDETNRIESETLMVDVRQRLYGLRDQEATK